MKTVCLFAVLVGALLAVAPQAGAQMMVDRETGERVDHPYAPSFYARPHRSRHHHGRRYGRSSEPRILALQRTLATPQPFGWGICCL